MAEKKTFGYTNDELLDIIRKSQANDRALMTSVYKNNESSLLKEGETALGYIARTLEEDKNTPEYKAFIKTFNEAVADFIKHEDRYAF